MTRFTLTAECEAEDENDACAKFVDLIPFLLVNDFQESQGVSLSIARDELAKQEEA